MDDDSVESIAALQSLIEEQLSRQERIRREKKAIIFENPKKNLDKSSLDKSNTASTLPSLRNVPKALGKHNAKSDIKVRNVFASANIPFRSFAETVRHIKDTKYSEQSNYLLSDMKRNLQSSPVSPNISNFKSTDVNQFIGEIKSKRSKGTMESQSSQLRKSLPSFEYGKIDYKNPAGNHSEQNHPTEKKIQLDKHTVYISASETPPPLAIINTDTQKLIDQALDDIESALSYLYYFVLFKFYSFF